MGATEQRLCLVDGSGILYRAFHALPPLATRTGLPTGAVYGFASMLVKLIREHDCTRLAVAFDAPGRTFRDDAFEGYKATRPETPADLRAQFPYVRRLVRALGVPLLEVVGVEADDVIGTLTRAATARGIDVLIVTSDKDMMQLVGPGTTLLDTMRDRTTGVDEVRLRLGVRPDQVVDVMALMGDSVDNIPGVRGIGEKTASRLIDHFGSLSALYESLDRIEEAGVRGAARVRAALDVEREKALQSQFLATIRTDVPLELRVEDLVRGEPDQADLRRLSEELEFAKLLRDFLETETAPALRSIRHADAAEMERWAADREALGIAIAAGGQAVAMAALGAEAVLVGEAIPSFLRARFASPGISTPRLYVEDLKATLHDLGLDRALGAAGAAEEAGLFDVSLAAYVLDSSRRAYGIDAIVSDRLGRPLPGSDPPGHDRLAAVAEALAELGPMLEGDLAAASLSGLYRELELPLARVLAIVEARGLRVDCAVLERAGREFRSAAEALERDIHDLAGGAFNIQSPNQLREVLFEKLKLPTKGIRRGKTGLSVDADVLTRLAESHPIAAKICEHRALVKLLSTYVTSLVNAVDRESERLRTSINQTVAATGRLSSSDPNLQNVPVRTAEGRRIREAFVAPAGMLLLAGDYSQIELRVLAHLTEDPVLVEAFRAGEDIHRRTAAEVFSVAPGEVTPDMRRQAKVINFGILYGMGPQRLSRELRIPAAEADRIIQRYFEGYASVRAFADRVIADGRRDGFVSTMLGRRRYLPDLASPVPNLRQAAERMGWNSPIQGTAADIIKLAMLRLERALEEGTTGARMILQVHDELLVEVPEGAVAEAGRVVRECMESVVALAVPLVVDLKKGPNWAEMS